MKLSIDHLTHYQYEHPLRHSTQYLRLMPVSGPHQNVIEWEVEAPGVSRKTRDGFGNVMHVLTMEQPVSDIEIRSYGVVETTGAIDEVLEDHGLSPLVFLRTTDRTVADEPIIDLAEQFRRRTGTLSGLRELSTAVRKHMPFLFGVTDVHYSAAEAFGSGNGVCQDHAHVFIAACRYLGIPARYVSGYLHSPLFSDAHVSSHAWAEAWVVDRWRSFDITNDGPAGENHIRLAVGADYMDACPVRGVRTGGGVETMSARALVTPQ